MLAHGDDAELLHERLGHFSMGRINSALLGNSTTKFNKLKQDPDKCEACMLNRNRKAAPKQSKEPVAYTHFGQRISSDSAGPFPVSPGGFRYAVSFYDHWSKHVAVYFLKSHEADDILGALQTFLLDYKAQLVHTAIPGTVDEWFTDNSTEFLSHDTDD